MPQSYQPGPVPFEAELIPEYLQDELRGVSALLKALYEGFLEPTHIEPDKVELGMVRYADGTDWNPGSGEGVYFYGTGGWTFVGAGGGVANLATRTVLPNVADGTLAPNGGHTEIFSFTVPSELVGVRVQLHISVHFFTVDIVNTIQHVRLRTQGSGATNSEIFRAFPVRNVASANRAGVSCILDVTLATGTFSVQLRPDGGTGVNIQNSTANQSMMSIQPAI